MAQTKTKAAPAARKQEAAPAAKKQEVVKAGGSSKLPAFMRKGAGRGMEGLGAGDYEMPRVKLIQGISEEISLYNGVKAGDFFHTLAEESLGSELAITCLHISKRYVLWRPRWDGGGILARADDAEHWQPANAEFEVSTDKSKKNKVKWITKPTVAESGLAEWGSFDPDDPNSQPAATLCYVIVVYLHDFPDLSPVALLLQRTAIRGTRKLLGKLKVSGAPIYGLRFTMTSFDDNSSAGDFKNYRFTADGYVDEEQFEQFEQMHVGFSRTGVNVRDVEGAQDEAPAEAKAAAAREKRF